MLEDISFGIEIETCYHIINKSKNHPITDFDEKYKSGKKDNKDILYHHFNSIEEGVWKYCDPVDEGCFDYDYWTITSDPTVYCSTTEFVNDKYFITKNIQYNDIPDLEFWPVEFVSPILSLNKLDSLNSVWKRYIMDDNIVYTVNETQGLHVSVSVPNVPIKKYDIKFAKLWYIFEHILQDIISRDRLEFIYPSFLRANFKKVEDITRKRMSEIAQAKKLVIIIHENRIEVRLFNGTMVYGEIYYNILLVITFLNKVSELRESEFNRLLKIVNYDTRMNQFLKFIGNDNIISYFQAKQRENKSVIEKEYEKEN